MTLDPVTMFCAGVVCGALLLLSSMLLAALFVRKDALNASK